MCIRRLEGGTQIHLASHTPTFSQPKNEKNNEIAICMACAFLPLRIVPLPLLPFMLFPLVKTMPHHHDPLLSNTDNK